MQPTTHRHALLYIDHAAANLVFPDAAEAGKLVVTAHRAAKRVDGHRPTLDRSLVDALVDKLHGIAEILIVGPGTAKQELMSFLEQHHPDLAKRVVGVTAVDHPTEPQLIALAHEQFKRIDLWR